WMFPEKSKRLLVTLAGAWFEIFAWALATLFWRLTEPGTPPSYLALVIATTLGIKTLFNLNPLIKLDGYYLLSDWVEIPNLRAKAFEHIGRWFRVGARTFLSAGVRGPKGAPESAHTTGTVELAADRNVRAPAHEGRIFWL